MSRYDEEKKLAHNSTRPIDRGAVKTIGRVGLRTGELLADTGRVGWTGPKFLLYFALAPQLIFEGENGNRNAHSKLATTIVASFIPAIAVDFCVLPKLVTSPPKSLLEAGIDYGGSILLNGGLIAGVLFCFNSAANEVKEDWGKDRKYLKQKRQARRQRLGLS